MQNYVGQALQNLSGTVEGIGRQAGDNRLKLSELGLKRAAYEMGLPELSLKRDKALDETARRNQPVNVSMLTQPNNPESVFHILGNQKTEGMPPPYQAVGNIFGATVDAQGNYIVNGKPLTNWEFNQKAAQVQRVMGFYTDPKKAMSTRSNMAQKSLDSGIDTRTGQPLDEKMKMNLAGGIEKVSKMTDSDYLRGYQQQLADMEASKAPFIDSGGDTTLIDAAIGRVQGKIDSYKAAVAKTADRTYQTGLTTEERTYNEGRDRIKQDWELDKIDRRNTGNVSNAANKIEANKLEYRQDMLTNVDAQMKPILELNPAMTPEQQKKQRAIFKARYINDTRGVQVQPIQNEQTGQTQFWDGKKIVNEFLEPIQTSQITKTASNVRQKLYPGEDDYFKKNKNVTGMAADDDKIILNPYSNLSETEKQSVIKNESARLYMRKNGIVPDFDVTDKQMEYFKDTAYEGNLDAIKQTIAARVISGDPSIKPTENQKKVIATLFPDEYALKPVDFNQKLPDEQLRDNYGALNPNYSDYFVNEKGAIYAKNKIGKTVLIMRKPSSSWRGQKNLDYNDPTNDSVYAKTWRGYKNMVDQIKGPKYTGDLEKLRKIYPNLSEKELLEMAQQL